MENVIKNKIDNNKQGLGVFDLISQAIIFILLAVSLAINNEIMTIVIVILALGYVSIANNEKSFYFIVGLTIYQYSFTIKGDNAIFLVLIVYLLKLFIFGKVSFKNKLILVIASAVILGIELFNDKSAESKG